MFPTVPPFSHLTSYGKDTDVKEKYMYIYEVPYHQATKSSITMTSIRRIYHNLRTILYDSLIQAAVALSYLKHARCIVRNVCTRNCLISTAGRIKIGNFGENVTPPQGCISNCLISDTVLLGPETQKQV